MFITPHLLLMGHIFCIDTCCLYVTHSYYLEYFIIENKYNIFELDFINRFSDSISSWMFYIPQKHLFLHNLIKTNSKYLKNKTGFHDKLNQDLKFKYAYMPLTLFLNICHLTFMVAICTIKISMLWFKML